MPFSKPILESDYYAQFQTALYIAVEELGVKQAFLADICGISPGYLSKLRGWNCTPPHKRLRPRPHMTNTNFKSYAVPLIHFLKEQSQTVRFENGMFTQQIEDTVRQWGTMMLLDNETLDKPPIAFRPTPPEKLPNLDGIEFPPEGELLIEWAFDFERDPTSKERAIALLHQLSERANGKVTIQVKLTTASSPPKALDQQDYVSRSARAVSSPSPTRHLPAQISNTPFFRFAVVPPSLHSEQMNGLEHITIRDNLNNRIMEQFCDLPDWNEWHKQDESALDETRKSFFGQGLNQYFLSRQFYGRQPFIVHAELEFQGYTTHEDHPTDNANAGFIVGWHHQDGHPFYYHLLLTGKKMLLEHVGGKSGDAYEDYEHLDPGVDFHLEDGIGYHFLLRVGSDSLDVLVNHQHVYHVAIPENRIGKVGLRPWRSKLTCRFFEVRELAARTNS